MTVIAVIVLALTYFLGFWAGASDSWVPVAIATGLLLAAGVAATV